MNRNVYESIFFVIFGFVALCVLAYIASISFNLTTVEMYIFIGLGILSITLMLLGANMFISEMSYTFTKKEETK